MIKNKRGQEFSLNTIVIAIIVVVVLIVVVSFFLFGFKGLTDRVKSIFFGTTAGTDKTLAVQQCNNFCDQLELLPDSALAGSPYCKYPFNIDENNDGEAEFAAGADGKKIYYNYYCNKPTAAGEIRSLGVDCVIRRGDTSTQYTCPS